MSQKYIEDVNNGLIKDVDKTRLDSCWKAIDKCVPNPPSVTVTHESETPPDFNVIYEQAD